jgi:hypothetical protein
MIQNVSMSSNAVPSIAFAITASRSNSGKMSLPVSHANYIYSHFRHVSGTLAPEGARGVSINRMKMLDVLIDRLAQLKKQGVTVTGPVSEEQVDALIEQYEQQIRQVSASQTAAVAIPYQSVPVMQPGAIFNLVA